MSLGIVRNWLTVSHVQTWQLPASKAYSAQEWEDFHPETSDAIPANDQPAENGSEAALKMEADKKDADGDSVMQDPENPLLPPKDPGSDFQLTRGVREKKALTLKERLEICQATEKERLTFCKVQPASCPQHS